MKLCLVLLLFITICASQEHNYYQDSVYINACIGDQEAIHAFRAASDAFTAKISRIAAVKGRYTLTISPHEIWLNIAAIAEGADQAMKKELFTLLNLPEDQCSRHKIYQVATTRQISNQYVVLDHSRTLFIGEGSFINPHWYNVVRENSLMQVIPVPLRFDLTTTTAIIKQTLNSKTKKINLSGNSIITSSFEYNGLWTNAFDNATIKWSPFYSQTGQRIGSVDLMTVRRRVRIGYVASTNLKVIEIPIGANNEFSMIFGLVVDNDASLVPVISNWNDNTVTESLAALHNNYAVIDIAIPKFVMSSEIDVREILEDLGVSRLWRDPGASRYTSTPPAMPSSFIQRATVTLTSRGVEPPLYVYPSYPTNNKDSYWSEFIADRPFIFGLFDTETYTCLMVTMYSKPTYAY